MSRGYFLYILVGFCANFGRLFSSSRNLYVATLLSFSLMFLFYLSKKKKKKIKEEWDMALQIVLFSMQPPDA